MLFWSVNFLEYFIFNYNVIVVFAQSKLFYITKMENKTVERNIQPLQ